MLRTIRFRTNNKNKYHGLERTAGDCRFIWNRMWERFKPDDFKDDYGHGTLGNILRDLKSDIKNYWLNDMSAYILQHSLLDFTRVCSRYKKGLSGEPKPKGKLKTVPSFPVHPKSTNLKDKWINIYKAGWIRLIGNNPYPDGVFKLGRVKKECGKWYTYLVYEVEDKKEVSKELQVVSIDRNSGQGDCRSFNIWSVNCQKELYGY